MRKVRQKAKKILTVYTGIIFVCTSCSKCTLYDVWFMYEGLLNFLISKMLQTFIFNLFRVFFFFHRVDMHPNIQVKWLLDVSYICKVVMSKSGRREIVTNSFRLIVAELQKSFLYKLLINGYIVRRNMQTKLYRIIIFTKKKKKTLCLIQVKELEYSSNVQFIIVIIFSIFIMIVFLYMITYFKITFNENSKLLLLYISF